MKKVNLKSITLIISMVLTSITYSIENKKQMISVNATTATANAKEVLINYLKAGDESNVKLLEELTHKQYRVIFKDVTKDEVSEINRSSYLELIEKKVFGGKPRKVEILYSEIIENNMAHFKIKTSSDGVVFISYFSLVNEQGKWYVLQDLIYMKAN